MPPPRLPASSARTPPAIARRVMRLHLGYLLCLPLLAAVGMGFDADLARAALFGWLPYFCYAMTVRATYALSLHPLRMAIVVLAVPTELLIENLLFHHSVRFYFIEAAAIEVTALVAGLFVAMLLYRPSGWVGAFVGAAIVASSCLAFGAPLYERYRELPPAAWVALGIALLSASWSYAQLVMPAARGFARGGGGVRTDLRFDGGWLGRVLAPGPDEELIGPGAEWAAGTPAR